MSFLYVNNPETNVFKRISGSAFDYSDGEEVELRLLSAVKEAKDISAASSELADSVVDWPSEYHLSSARHNLLRPFKIRSEHTVLEFGCGCGAMTRYLGETGASIIAVEGSQRRAQIAAERCRDLSNVRIVCDNLMDFDTDQRFDFVTLIGVLEYAPRYILAIDPVAACLIQARSFLKPDGVLVVAIENQLGLKYFNGCGEDHLGTPYYGLHGLYRDDEPTTFGRAALEKRLVAGGLPHHRFFYPFPDYKLPQVLLSDDALSTPGFDASALLAGMPSSNAEGGFHPNFHENLAWRPIIDNGLLPQLANSFLIFAAASADALSKFQIGSFGYAYSTNRTLAFATETHFYRSDHDVLVEKRSLYPNLSLSNIELSAGNLLHRVNTVCDYIIGFPFLMELQQRLGRGEGIPGIIEWVAPWFDLLLAHSAISESGATLPGDWIDAIPQNCIRTTDGSLRRIDQEWVLDRSIPLHWIVVRGLNNAISFSPTSPALAGITVLELMVKVASVKGICLTDEQIVDAMQRESKLRTLIYGGNETENLERLRTVINGGCRCHLDDYLLGEFARDKIDYLDSEIARVKSSFSWQITKPLRLLEFIWRKLNAKLRKK